MWLPPLLTGTAPTAPWAAADARAAVLRLGDVTAFDTEISMHLAAAIAAVENMTGQRLAAQTVDLKASSFADLERLPIAPVTSISSVKYLDATGVEQTVTSTDYELIGAKLVWSIRPIANVIWPVHLAAEDAIRVRAVVGYATSAALALEPELKAAVMLKVRAMFDGGDYDCADLLANQRIWL
jgi:uncharacterized phiE125 gp8 family phage protein